MLSTEGGGGGLVDTDPKGSIDAPPKNPTETDPRALEVTGPKIRQKMKIGFLESTCRGSSSGDNPHLPCILFICFIIFIFGEQQFKHFQCSKKFRRQSSL